MEAVKSSELVTEDTKQQQQFHVLVVDDSELDSELKFYFSRWSQQVSDEGDVLYVFPKDYRAKLLGKSFRLTIEPILEKAKAGTEYVARVSFGTALIASIVLVYTAIIVALSSSSREDDNRGRCGRSYDSGFTFYMNPVDLFCYLIASMGLPVLWSFGLACLHIYALRRKRDLQNPILVSLCYVQFPQRFDGIDRSDRYANRNDVFFDVNMKGLDGIQGPVYVGTGCCFSFLGAVFHLYWFG